MLKTEGEARGFQHFPADIKSVTSLLVPFLEQYQFSNKNQFNLNKYESISERLHSAAYYLPPTCCVILTQSPWPAYALVPNSRRRELSKLVQKGQ